MNMMEDIDEWNQLAGSCSRAMDTEYLTKPMLDTLRGIAANEAVQRMTQDMCIQFLMLKDFIRLDQPQGYYVTDKGKSALVILGDDTTALPPPH